MGCRSPESYRVYIYRMVKIVEVMAEMIIKGAEVECDNCGKK